ncbi:MAG: SGNH/GDSL hydrolase family protein [Pseudomonadota bacterium]
MPRPWNQKNLEANPEGFFQFEDTYPYLLRQYLRAHFPRQRLSVSTLSSRGGTFKRTQVFANDLFSWMGAKVVVVHFGIVDCWLRDEQQQLTSPEEFQTAVRDLVVNHTKMGPDILLIVIGILPTNKTMLAKKPKQNEAIAQFNQILRDGLEDQSAVFLDVERTFAHQFDDIIHLDGHHLSKTGHQVYAEAICKTILSGFDLTGKAGSVQTDINALKKRVGNNIKDGEFDTALADVTETLGPAKDEAFATALIGEIEFARGDFKVAFRHLSTAAKHFPTDIGLWKLTALSASRVLPPADALSFLAHAHAINPESCCIALHLIKALSEQELYQQALVVCDRFQSSKTDTSSDDTAHALQSIALMRGQILDRIGSS